MPLPALAGVAVTVAAAAPTAAARPGANVGTGCDDTTEAAPAFGAASFLDDGGWTGAAGAGEEATSISEEIEARRAFSTGFGGGEGRGEGEGAEGAEGAEAAEGAGCRGAAGAVDGTIRPRLSASRRTFPSLNNEKIDSCGARARKFGPGVDVKRHGRVASILAFRRVKWIVLAEACHQLDDITHTKGKQNMD